MMNDKRLIKQNRIKLLPLILGGVVFLGCAIYGIVLFSDYSMLKSSSLYADGPVGLASRVPPIAHSYNRLKASPFAVLIFKALERYGTNEGKLYALQALKTLDVDYFNSLAAKYRESNEKAKCQHFDMLDSIYLRDVFPNETISESTSSD